MASHSQQHLPESSKLAFPIRTRRPYPWTSLPQTCPDLTAFASPRCRRDGRRDNRCQEARRAPWHFCRCSIVRARSGHRLGRTAPGGSPASEIRRKLGTAYGLTCPLRAERPALRVARYLQSPNLIEYRELIRRVWQVSTGNISSILIGTTVSVYRWRASQNLQGRRQEFSKYAVTIVRRRYHLAPFQVSGTRPTPRASGRSRRY